ncbi:hypothetical protein [Megalodesulfovibrio paquesii]
MSDSIANAWLRVSLAASVDHAAAHLSLALDDAMHQRLYGEVRTTFQYGEAVYLRLHAWPASMSLAFALSDGTLDYALHGTETRVERLVFANGPSASLSLPAVDGSLQVRRWLGASLPGALRCRGTRVTAAALSADALAAAVAEVEYRVAWQGRRFVLPVREAEDWTVCLAVRGTVEEGIL